MSENLDRFTDRPQIEFARGPSEDLGKDLWRVINGFRYYLDDTQKTWVDVEPGYLTDGASVPRPFWSIVPPWGKYAAAVCVHDKLCEYLRIGSTEGDKKITRKRADEILEQALKDLDVDDSTESKISNAVHTFRVVTNTSEGTLDQSKRLMEASWREKNGINVDEHISDEVSDQCNDPDVAKAREEQNEDETIDATRKRFEKLRKSLDREWIISDKTAVESGYVNNEDDLGGATNHGITEKKAREHEAKLGELFEWDGDMRNLTKEMAYYIYTEDYWKTMHLDEVMDIEPLIADKLFDIGINAGTKRAVLWLQHYVNVCNRKGELYSDMPEDGLMGPTTLERIRQYERTRGKRSIARLLWALVCQQGSHYIAISHEREDNETFTYGWMKRIEHNSKLYFEALWE